MKEIVLAGKKRKVVATVGSVRAMLRNYDLTNMQEWKEDKIYEFAIDLIWRFLVPRWFGIKVYLWRGRFGRKLDVEEMRNAQSILMDMLYGTDMADSEDKEQGNQVESQ